MYPREVLDAFTVDPESPSGLLWAYTVGRGSPIKYVGSIAGTQRPSGYWQVTFQGKMYSNHRLIAQKEKVPGWELLDDSRYEVDHIIAVSQGGTNAPSNLQVITCRANSAKRSSRSQCKLGAYKRNNRWRAGACINGKMRWLGTFDTEDEAHEAYLKAIG